MCRLTCTSAVLRELWRARPQSEGSTLMKDGDAPGGVDFVPAVVAVQYPGADDAHVRSERGTNDAAPGAFPEFGDVAKDDSPAGCAAKLVARHDLDVQAALASIVRVQHGRVAGVGRGLEAQIAVGVLHGRLGDRPLERGAPAQHLQPVGTMYTIVGVPLA